MRIFSDIHLVDGVVCNVYIITEPDGLTVVDAGVPGAEKRILAAIAQLGYAPRDVRRILLTHQHFDHVGGLSGLVAATGAETGAETWASAGDADAIEGKARREAPHGALGLVFRGFLLPRVRRVTVARRLSEGETVPALAGEGGLRVIETPGHTMGHIAFYLPTRRLLLAGDAVRAEGQRLAPPPPIFNADTPLALKSVARLAALDVEAVLPGHGAPLIHGAGAELARLAGLLASVRA